MQDCLVACSFNGKKRKSLINDRLSFKCSAYVRKRSCERRLMESLRSRSEGLQISYNRWRMMSVANAFLRDCGLMNMIASYFLHSITHQMTQLQNPVKLRCDEMSSESSVLRAYHRWDVARLSIRASFLFASQVTTFCQLEALITAGVSSEINIRASRGQRLLWSDGEDREVKEKL